MADSLILTGVKGISKHTGDELLLTRPKRGGDTHKLKEWWHGTNGTQYVDCSVFNVTALGDTFKLAIASTGGTSVRVEHDGELNFNFYSSRNVSRICLFSKDFEIIEHYVLPSISGGKVMTVKPANALAKPIPPKPVVKTVEEPVAIDEEVKTEATTAIPVVKLSKKSAKKKKADS